ncbi:uncharacterized protein LAJ45_03749 [Morchella importuna]|uniref:uncharacterized protein n=1 Tax=Morchella importuna TaxID=1174673 RepID=UPI001E8EABA3|nr:uncharacterized protein LAJ45_03749 [Morchella importuna]KAH8152322.1 hypothetical protein LAJ45_03749 [Morchella importuna]
MTQFIGPALPPCPIPPYLLPDILQNLPHLSLLPCRLVCRHWKHTLDSTLPLRHRLFTAPPPRSSSTSTYDLNPVFRTIDYHLHAHLAARSHHTGPLKHRIAFRLNNHSFHDSYVADTFATAPAARRVKVTLCGGSCVVEREHGVTVWDLMAALDELVKERHERQDGVQAPAARQLEWDCTQFPFAGFRVVAATSDGVHIKPEFLNLWEVTRCISRVPMEAITAPPVITFDVEHDL